MLASTSLRLRWHTGATLRPLAPGEPCPALFRDVGPAALAVFLRGALRRRPQSGDRAQRERARAEMERVGLTEADLCAAWHHLPRPRRAFIVEALRRIEGTPCS